MQDQLYVLEFMAAERGERLRADGRKHALRVRNHRRVKHRYRE